MVRELIHLYSVFMIAATSTYVQFIHFTFGTNCDDYHAAGDSASQHAVTDDVNRDAFVRMQSTHWFNLQSSEGRRIALCHVLALLRWHDNHPPLGTRAANLSVTSDSIAGDEDESMNEDSEMGLGGEELDEE
jgi:hypothetical protein